MSAESEYGSLIARVESRLRRFQVEAIGAKIREVFMHVDTALGQDVPAPRRSSPASWSVNQERDGAVWRRWTRPRTAVRRRGPHPQCRPLLDSKTEIEQSAPW